MSVDLEDNAKGEDFGGPFQKYMPTRDSSSRTINTAWRLPAIGNGASSSVVFNSWTSGPKLLALCVCKDYIHQNDHHREGHNDINRDALNLMSQLVSQPSKPQPDSVYTALWRHAITLDQAMRDREASHNRSFAVGLETSDLPASRHSGYSSRLYETISMQQGFRVTAAVPRNSSLTNLALFCRRVPVRLDSSLTG
ncbi:hypothetical protein GGI42DRAFT_351427 [Trichoderma sp. SZMC 28013]